MIRRGAFDLPIIGIARSARDIDELRARVRERLEEHGGTDADAFGELSAPRSATLIISGRCTLPAQRHERSAPAADVLVSGELSVHRSFV
jgi:hypothetical protein